MDIIKHYQSLLIEQEDCKILCLLLDTSLTNYNLGLGLFSKKISSHVGTSDLTRLLKNLIPNLITTDAFLIDKDKYLTPKEALTMIDSILYLEILYEESKRNSG